MLFFLLSNRWIHESHRKLNRIISLHCIMKIQFRMMRAVCSTYIRPKAATTADQYHSTGWKHLGEGKSNENIISWNVQIKMPRNPMNRENWAIHLDLSYRLKETNSNDFNAMCCHQFYHIHSQWLGRKVDDIWKEINLNVNATKFISPFNRLSWFQGKHEIT